MRGTKEQQRIQTRGLQLRAVSINVTSKILFFFNLSKIPEAVSLKKNQSLTTIFS
jgi:hypothetical protein